MSSSVGLWASASNGWVWVVSLNVWSVLSFEFESFEFEVSPFWCYGRKLLFFVFFSDRETIRLFYLFHTILSKHRQHHTNVACLDLPQHVPAIVITPYMHLGAKRFGTHTWPPHPVNTLAKTGKQDTRENALTIGIQEGHPGGGPTNRDPFCAAVPNSEGVSPGYDPVAPLVPSAISRHRIRIGLGDGDLCRSSTRPNRCKHREAMLTNSSSRVVIGLLVRSSAHLHRGLARGRGGGQRGMQCYPGAAAGLQVRACRVQDGVGQEGIMSWTFDEGGAGS